MSKYFGIGDTQTLTSALNAMNAALMAPQTKTADNAKSAEEDKAVSVNIPWVPIILTLGAILGAIILLRKKK